MVQIRGSYIFILLFVIIIAVTAWGFYEANAFALFAFLIVVMSVGAFALFPQIHNEYIEFGGNR